MRTVRLSDCVLLNVGAVAVCSFHPCVRLTEWTNQRHLSFTPPVRRPLTPARAPRKLTRKRRRLANLILVRSHAQLSYPQDGDFKLCDYIIGPETQISMPVSIRPSFTFGEGHGKLDIEVQVKHTGGRDVDSFVLTIPMPKQVNSVNLQETIGSHSFDQVRGSRCCCCASPRHKPSPAPDDRPLRAVPAQVTKTIRWEVKKMPAAGMHRITGAVSVPQPSQRVLPLSVAFSPSN